LFVEVAEIFLEDFEVQLSQVNSPESTKEEVARAFHSLAGSAGNIGAKDLSLASKQMELLVKDEGSPAGKIKEYLNLSGETIEIIKKTIQELSNQT